MHRAESAWKALVYCGLVALELHVSVHEKCARRLGQPPLALWHTPLNPCFREPVVCDFASVGFPVLSSCEHTDAPQL